MIPPKRVIIAVIIYVAVMAFAIACIYYLV